MKKDIWIAGITRGHNGGVCLLKNGEIIFSIEEERISRNKYDGGPFASMVKILDYTDKLDYLVIAHTQGLQDTAGKVDFTGDDVYTGLARKLGLIERKGDIYNHPQVVDLSYFHHKLHAACAFYRSGFDKAAALIVDGAGTFIPLSLQGESVIGWETETIFDCSYPANFKTVYKHIGTRGPNICGIINDFPSDVYKEENHTHIAVITDRAGITKTYEAATHYCGFSFIEAGKTMGLFPYGNPNNKIPKLFDSTSTITLSNRNVVIPTYPNGAIINSGLFPELEDNNSSDLTKLQNRRDLAWAVQKETQEQVLNLILKTHELTGHKKIVISGGYALNCVANYYYLEGLKDTDIEIYVEPISNDAGTAMGAAMMFYRALVNDEEIKIFDDNLYLGPKHHYSQDEIIDLIKEYEAEVSDAEYKDVVNLLVNQNIVAMFQGRSENGPRALGNRSILFDPRVKNGKDLVNGVKHREYFRPFAGTILEEYTNNWFDLRGKSSSPSMMYAVNCLPGIEEKIPSIIHVDGTCRIQTVNEKQNKHFYNLIKEFYKETDVPILFNTSFNLGGDPLVETLKDALETLNKSELEYLYLPEYKKLIKIPNK